MPTAQELREERAPVATKIQELADRVNDADHEWSGEDEQEWTRVNAEYDRLSGEIEKQERVERAQSVSDEQKRPVHRGREVPGRGDSDGHPSRQDRTEAPAEETRALAMQAWFRHQAGETLTDEHEEACRSVGLNPRRTNLDVSLAPHRNLAELQRQCRNSHPALWSRDLSAVTGGSGGFTVPEGFVNSLERNMLFFGGMLQVAEIIRTDSGEPMPWPTADDTGNTGEQLGESASIGSSVDPTMSQITWNAYKFSSKLIKVPVELLEDSAFDLARIIGEMLGERLGRIQNTKFTTGTGAATPNGIMTAATLGVTAASSTAIIADELLDLEHSIDPAYRTADARYMMHDDVLLALRKLKDGEGRYLFQSNLREGGPDTINGRQFTINNDMSSTITSSDKTVLFGQLNKYKIRQVRQIRLRRLIERYADNDQEGFIAFLRTDGNLLDAGTAPVKFLQMA